MADAGHSKCFVRKDVRVQVPHPAPTLALQQARLEQRADVILAATTATMPIIAMGRPMNGRDKPTTTAVTASAAGAIDEAKRRFSVAADTETLGRG